MSRNKEIDRDNIGRHFEFNEEISRLGNRIENKYSTDDERQDKFADGFLKIKNKDKYEDL